MSTLRDASGRAPLRHSLWGSWRKELLVPVVMSALSLVVVLLADMSYVAGAVFKQSTRVKALKIIAVDYDGAEIGQAISGAYQNLQGDSFPTLEYRSASEYPDPAALRQAVCKGDFWGAVYTHQGASDRLSAALNGDSPTVNYDPADTVTYIYNGARYSTVADSMIRSNLETLIATSRFAYYQTTNGTDALASLNRTDRAAVAAYLNPIESSPEVIKQMHHGSRVLYGTILMVIPLLAQFFFIMAINGISTHAEVFTKMRVRDVWLFRFICGKVFTLLMGLVIAGYVWAFRENWDVDGRAFALTWMVMWLYMDVQWQVIESLVGTYIPMQYTSFFVVTWVLVNMASALTPFELSAGWYRIGYALPAQEAFSLLVQVWSGCADQTRIALPVLFSYWAVGHVTAVFSVRKRCLDAKKEPSAAGSGDTGSKITVDSSTDLEMRRGSGDYL